MDGISNNPKYIKNSGMKFCEESSKLRLNEFKADLFSNTINTSTKSNAVYTKVPGIMKNMLKIETNIDLSMSAIVKALSFGLMKFHVS